MDTDKKEMIRKGAEEQRAEGRARAEADFPEAMEKVLSAPEGGAAAMAFFRLPEEYRAVIGEQFSVGEPLKYYTFSISDELPDEYAAYTERMTALFAAEGIAAFPVIFHKKTRRRFYFPSDIYDIRSIYEAKRDYILAMECLRPVKDGQEDGREKEKLLETEHEERMKLIHMARTEGETRAFADLPGGYKLQLFAFTPVISALCFLAAVFSHQLEKTQESGPVQTLFLILIGVGFLSFFLWNLIGGKRSNEKENARVRRDNGQKEAVYQGLIDAENARYAAAKAGVRSGDPPTSPSGSEAP